MVKENKRERNHKKRDKESSNYKIPKKSSMHFTKHTTHMSSSRDIDDKPFFDIAIYDIKSKKLLQEFHTQTDRFVIAEQNQTFNIKVGTNSENVYGMKLMIDGQVVCPPRTFKKRAKIIGFREGLETYREFKFDLPKIDYSENLTEEDRQRILKSGTIKVEFYNTREILIEGEIKPCRSTKTTQFLTAKRLSEKKFFTKSLSIAKGNLFKRPSDLGFLRKKFNPSTGKSTTYSIEKDKVIATVEVKYTDFNSLLLMGHLNMYNLEHLKYIPLDVLRKNHYLVGTIFKTLLNNKDQAGLTTNELKEKFVKYTQKSFDVIGLGDISYYFVSSSHDFELKNGKIYYKNTKSFLSQTLKDLSPDNLVPQRYYQTEANQRFKSADPSLKKIGFMDNPIVLND